LKAKSTIFLKILSRSEGDTAIGQRGFTVAMQA